MNRIKILKYKDGREAYVADSEAVNIQIKVNGQLPTSEVKTDLSGDDSFFENPKGKKIRQKRGKWVVERKKR